MPEALGANIPEPTVSEKWHPKDAPTASAIASLAFWPQELRPYLNVGLVSSNTQDPRRASDLSHMGEITSESKKIPLNSLHDARLHTELPVYLRVA